MTNFQRYILQVKHHLKCPPSKKKEILECLTFCMEDFLENESDLPMHELYRRFGEPRIAAEKYMQEVPELHKYRMKILAIKIMGLLVSIVMVIMLYLLVINSQAYEVVDTKPEKVTNPSISQIY